MCDNKKIRNAILVKDTTVNDIRESELLVFLTENGFSKWKSNGYPTCNWVYISLTDKTYMPGIPGISITPPLGDHAITVDEFIEIFSIFKKYEGLEVLCMTKQE